MGIDEILRNALMLLEMCHVLGMDADKFSAAKKNIQACIDTIEKAKKEETKRDHHDEPGEDVQCKVGVGTYAGNREAANMRRRRQKGLAGDRSGL